MTICVHYFWLYYCLIYSNYVSCAFLFSKFLFTYWALLAIIIFLLVFLHVYLSLVTVLSKYLNFSVFQKYMILIWFVFTFILFIFNTSSCFIYSSEILAIISHIMSLLRRLLSALFLVALKLECYGNLSSFSFISSTYQITLSFVFKISNKLLWLL